MVRYVVSNLGTNTPQTEQDKLLAALGRVKGIKDIELSLARKEITFGINGPEPRAKAVQEACASAGFTLGQRM